MLPGPAYPTSNGVFGSQNTYTGTTPVKISASHKTQGFLPPNSSLKNELGTPQQTDSTLHYGRRPGHTNSVTSPLALFPVNVNAHHGGLRRESHGAAAARPSPHGLSPLTKPIRLVSDPLMQPSQRAATATHSPLQEPTKRQFAYGMHSPLILAANAQRPASTSAVDFSHANGTPGKRAGRSSTDRGTTHGSEVPLHKQQIAPGPVDPRQGDNSLISRRRSFPAHLMGSLRSQLKTPLKSKNVSSTTTSESDEDSSALVSSTELQVPPSAARTDDGRGRSRDRRSSPAIREESTGDNNVVGEPRDSEITESRRHLGFSTDRSRTGRSSSRRARAGSSDDERNGRRSRDREGSRGRAAAVAAAGPHVATEHTVPLPTPHLLRQGYPTRDLSTIVGSLQQSDEDHSGRVDRSRSRPRSELRRLTSSGAGIV